MILNYFGCKIEKTFGNIPMRYFMGLPKKIIYLFLNAYNAFKTSLILIIKNHNKKNFKFVTSIHKF